MDDTPVVSAGFRSSTARSSAQDALDGLTETHDDEDGIATIDAEAQPASANRQNSLWIREPDSRRRGSDPQPKSTANHGNSDRRDPAVLSYLREENAHTESHLLHLKPLVGQLYDEIVGSILQDDDDLEFSWGEWTYFVRTTKGKAYPVVLRNRVEGGNSESNIKGTPVNGGSRKGSSTVVLDVNEIAKNLKYCSIGTFKPSPCHSILAYSVDSNGYETYDVKFKDLETGKAMSDVLVGTSGAVSWGRCSVSMGKQSHRTVFYSTQDDAHRVDKVWMQALTS